MDHLFCFKININKDNKLFNNGLMIQREIQKQNYLKIKILSKFSKMKINRI